MPTRPHVSLQTPRSSASSGWGWPTSVGMLLPQWAQTVRSVGLASARNCDPFWAIASPTRLSTVKPGCCDLHLDLYVRSLHADRVARDAAWRGRPQHGAGLDVVDGPMPRARDLLARHLALGERAATVGAGVVDGVEAPLQVEEGDLLSRRLDTLRLAWSDVSRARDPNELPHVSLLVTHSKRPVSLASKPHVS